MRTKIITDSEGQRRIPLTDEENAQWDIDEQVWNDGATSREAKQNIARLEASITNRRMREANLTVEGKAWLEAKDAEIAIERAKL